MKRTIPTTLLLAAVLMILPSLAADALAGRPQLQAERLRVGRELLEVQFSNVAEVLPYYTDDIEYHDPIVDIYGIEQMTGFLYQLLGASPDLVTRIVDEALSKDTYTATWIMAGQFLGVPYEAKGISIFQFRERSAQVYYQRDYYSEGDIMATIPGLDQAIGGFRTYYRCAVDPTFDCPLEGAATEKSNLPRTDGSFSLSQNAPNPFNPSTEISFRVPDGGANVTLSIYDVTGRRIRTLVDGFEPAGTRTVSWFGRDDHGQSVASGTYFYELSAPSFSEKRKMVLLK